ncbi:MAG TPA: hypothetical protein VH331_00585 [Allosphingosinicella sp.]|jgi:hypothetical protein|nr:hypothetical protein [Allosphingosinicella sp.]
MPFRVDVAILLLVLVAGALVYAALQARRRRRPPHGIRVDLVGGDRHPPEHPTRR